MAASPNKPTARSSSSPWPLTAASSTRTPAHTRAPYIPAITNPSFSKYVSLQLTTAISLARDLTHVQRYEVLTDPYHNIPRLNLYKFDGSPMMPLYLAYSPPEMLPTQTLNPTTVSSSAGAKATTKFKRSTDEITLPMNHKVLNRRREPIPADRWWWFGVFLTGSGAVLYFFF